MPINITNIINVVNAKLAALDSASDLGTIKALNTANDYIVNVGGVLSYKSASDLPVAEKGKIVFVEGADSSGKFYVGISADSGWDSAFRGSIIPDQFPSLANSFDSAYPWSIMGKHAGFVAGGGYGGAGGGGNTKTQKIAFANDNIAVHDIGSLYPSPAAQPAGYTTQLTNGAASSSSHGIVFGKSADGVVYKFPFSGIGEIASPAGTFNTTSPGNKGYGVSQNENDAFILGGYTNAAAPLYYLDMIDKYSFSGETTTNDVGTLNYAGYTSAASGPTYGYKVGGYSGTLQFPAQPPYHDYIEKFPYAISSGATASDVADLAAAQRYSKVINNNDNAYVFGGVNPSSPLGAEGTQDVEKFPFASDTNSAVVLQYTAYPTAYRAAATQSETHGYMLGGYGPWISSTSTNQSRSAKFSFASEEDAAQISPLAPGNGNVDNTSALQVGMQR